MNITEVTSVTEAITVKSDTEFIDMDPKDEVKNAVVKNVVVQNAPLYKSKGHRGNITVINHRDIIDEALIDEA